jgi:hypothetical protein
MSSWSGVSVARSELFFLLLICVSFALIDPPVDKVHDHNMDIADSEILQTNVLGEAERTPTLEDPTTFFYVRALTLTPSVNMSVTSKEGYHPWLIWIVAEDQVSSLTETNGKSEYEQDLSLSQYRRPVITWVPEESAEDGASAVMSFDEQGMAQEYYGPGVKLVPRIIWLDDEPEITEHKEEEDEGCEKTVITRNYEEMEIEDVSARYALSGILKNVDGNYSYETAHRDILLADNESFKNPSKVPFEPDPDLGCLLLSVLNKYLLGSMMVLECNDESLVRASPYATGTYNVTVRNLTVVNPRLDVTVTGVFSIFYTEDGLTCYEEEEDVCECDDWETNGTIILSDTDSLSYDVQNDYMTVVPYSPKFLSFDANTSENVQYYFSLMSNSELRKYYSRMDGKTAAAYYIHTFDVEEDGAGVRYIIAESNGSKGLLEEDPESLNNYTGRHRLLVTNQGVRLRSPTEVNNQSYNYSRAYSFKEVFYNLTPGSHHADMMIYTWWGNYSEDSDIFVRIDTVLTVSAYQSAEDKVTVGCTLRTYEGAPVPGQSVELSIGDEKAYATTGADGVCSAILPLDLSAGTVTADFKGSGEYMPSDDTFTMFASRPFFLGEDSLGLSFVLLLMIALLVGLLFMNIMTTMGIFGGAAPGSMLWGKMFAGRRGPGKKTIRWKKGKELAISVAGALAGGAGGAAAGKIAEKEAAKKMAKKQVEKAAKKTAEKKGKKKLEDAARKAYERKKKRAMMDGRGGVRAEASGRPRTLADADELLEKLRKKEEAKKKMRASQKEISPELVRAVQDDAEMIRKKKYKRIAKSLKDPASDWGALSVAKKRLEETKVFVVEKHTWLQETPVFGDTAFMAHGLNAVDNRGYNEIFMHPDRAEEELGRLKTLQHEFDHSVCLYKEDILSEGHAEWVAVHDSENKLGPKYVSYHHELATYEMLADLAGETPTKNHSAYAGGTEELKEKIIENHKGKLSEEKIERAFDFIVNTDVKHSEYAFKATKILYKKVKPEEYDSMMKKVKRSVGEI